MHSHDSIRNKLTELLVTRTMASSTCACRTDNASINAPLRPPALLDLIRDHHSCRVVLNMTRTLQCTQTNMHMPKVHKSRCNHAIRRKMHESKHSNTLLISMHKDSVPRNWKKSMRMRSKWVTFAEQRAILQHKSTSTARTSCMLPVSSIIHLYIITYSMSSCKNIAGNYSVGVVRDDFRPKLHGKFSSKIQGGTTIAHLATAIAPKVVS